MNDIIIFLAKLIFLIWCAAGVMFSVCAVCCLLKLFFDEVIIANLKKTEKKIVKPDVKTFRRNEKPSKLKYEKNNRK